LIILLGCLNIFILYLKLRYKFLGVKWNEI
jgi:hypothetical protein